MFKRIQKREPDRDFRLDPLPRAMSFCRIDSALAGAAAGPFDPEWDTGQVDPYPPNPLARTLDEMRARIDLLDQRLLDASMKPASDRTAPANPDEAAPKQKCRCALRAWTAEGLERKYQELREDAGERPRQYEMAAALDCSKRTLQRHLQEHLGVGWPL